MKIEKTLTGKFVADFEQTITDFSEWLVSHSYNFTCNSEKLTITVKFEFDSEYDEAVAVIKRFENKNNPQMTLEVG